MFDWNHNGKWDTGDSFMDFMVFHQVMDAGKKNGQNRKKQKRERRRSWMDRLEELEAMDDEDD